MLNSTKKRYLFSTLLFLFLCLATAVGFILLKRNQDNRQQASEVAAPHLAAPTAQTSSSPTPTVTTAPGSDLNKKGVVSTSYSGNRPSSQSGCGGQGVWMNDFCYMPGDELAGGKVILSSGRYNYPYIEDKKTYESVNFGAETVKKVVGTTESLGSNCGGQGLPINGTCYAYGSTVNGYLVMPPRTDNCNNATGDYCYAFLKKIEVPYVDWQAAVAAYEKDGNLQALEKLYQETYGVSFSANNLYNSNANNADLLKAQAILSALTSASVLQQQAAAENAELSKKGNLTADEQAVFDFNNQIINDAGLAGRYQVLDQLNQSTATQLTISTAVNRMYQDLVTAEGAGGLDALAKEKFIDIFGYDPSEKYGNLDGILGAFGIDSSRLNADRLKYSNAVAAQEQKIDNLNQEYQNYMSSSDANIEDLKKAAIDAGVVTADQLKGLSEAEALAILLTKFSNTSITEARQDALEIVTARNTAVQEEALVESFMDRGPQDSTMSDLSGLYTLYTGKSVNINVGPDDREALKAFLEAEVAKHNSQVALSLFAQTQDTSYLKNYYVNSSVAHSYGTWIPDDPKLLLSSIYGSAVGNELYTDIVLPSRFNQAVENFTLDGGASLSSVCRELKVTDCNINSSNSTSTISLMLDKMYGDDPEVNVPDLAVTYSNQIYATTKEEKHDSFWDLFIASVAMSNAGSGNYVYMEDSPQVSYYQQSMDNYSAAVDAHKVFNASQTFAYATTNRQDLSDYTWGLSYGNALMDDNVFDREFTIEEFGLSPKTNTLNNIGNIVNLTFNQLSSQWANVDVAQNIATNYATSKYYDYTGPADTGIANVALLGADNLGVLDYDYQAATGGYYVQKTLDNFGEEIGAFMVNAGSIYAASQMNEAAINQSLYLGEDNLTIIDPIEYANEATAEFRAEYSQEEAVKLYQTYLESTKADGATPVSQVTFEEFINDPEIQRSREELNYERLEKVVAPVAAAVVLPAMIVSGAGVPLLLGMSSSAFSLYQGAGMKAQALEIQRMDIESRENAIVQSYIENGASEQEIADLRESLDLQVSQLNQQGNLMLANSAVAAITSTGGFLTGLANAGTAANASNLLATSGQILTKTGQIGGIALNSYNAYNSGVASYNAFSEGNIGGGVMSGLSSLIAASGVAGNTFGLLGPTTYTNRIDYALDRLNIPAGVAVDAQQVSLACFGSSDAFSEKDCTNAWIGLALSAGQNVSQVSSSHRAYMGDVTTAKLTDLQKQLNAVDVEILSLRALGNTDPVITRQLELLDAQHANLSADILALNPNLRITNPGSVENYSATRAEILSDLDTRLTAARQAGNGDLEQSLSRQIQLFESSTDQVINLRSQIENIDRQVQEGGLSLKVEELADLQRERNTLVADLETTIKDLSVVESLRLQNEAMLQVAKQNEAIDVYREALNKLATVEAYAPKAEDVAKYEADTLKTGKVQLETEDSKRLLSIAAMQESANKLAKLEAERQALLKADQSSSDNQKALASVEAQITSLRKITDSATPSLWQRFTDLFASDKASRAAYYKALSLSAEAETMRVKLTGLDPDSPEAATARRQVADLDRQILDQKHVLASSLNKPTETQLLATTSEQFATLRDNYNEFLNNQDRLVKANAELAKLPQDLTDANQARAFQRLTAEINALTQRNTTLEASLLRDVVDAPTKQKLLATPKANLPAELQAARDVELGKIRSDLGLTAKQRRLVTDLIQLRAEVFKAQGDDLTLARSRYNDKLTELNSSILGRNPDLAAYQKLSTLQGSLKNITLFDQATKNPDALADLLSSKESAINLDDQLLSLKMETMIRETEFRAGVEEGLAFFNSRVNQIDTFLKIISDPRVAVELTTAGGKTFVGALVLKAKVEILDYATGLYIAKPGQEAKITRDLARMYGLPESDVVALDYTRLADKAYVASLLRSRYIVADPANLEFVRNGANNFSDGNFMVANQVYRKLTQNLSIYMDELQINIDPTRQAIVSVGASSEKIPTRYTEVDKFVGDVLAETVLRNGGWGLGDNDFLVLRTSEGAEIAKFSPEAQEQIFTALARKMGLSETDYNLVKDNVFALDEALSKGRGDLEQRLKALGSKLSTDQAEAILDQVDSLNTFAQGLKMKDGTDYKRMIDRVLQANNGLNRQVTVPAAGAVANEGQSYNARLQSVMEYIGAKAHGQTPDFDGLTASPNLAYKSNIADYIGDLQNSSIGAVTGAMADGFGVVETALGLTSYRSTEAVVKILDLENSSTGGRINVDRAYQIDRSDDISALVALKVNGQLNQSAGLATKGNLKIVLGFDGAKEPLTFAIGMARSRQFNQAQFAVQNSDGSYSLVKINQGGQVLESRPITTGEIQDMYRGGAENLVTIIGRGGATGDSIATNKSVLGVTVTSFDSPEGLVAQAGARIDRTSDVADQFALIVKPGAPRVSSSADLANSKMNETDFLGFRAKVLEVQLAVEKAKNTQALNQGVTSASTRVLADLIRNSTDPAVQRWASEKLLNFYKESTGRNLSLTGDAAEAILARQRQLANEVANWQKLFQDPANAAILRKIKGTDGDFYQRMLVNSGVDPAKLKYASGSRTQIAGREAVITARDLGEFISKHSKYVTQDSESRYVADSGRQPKTYQAATSSQRNPVDVAQNQAKTNQAVEALQKLAGSPVEQIGNLFLRGIGASNATRLTHLIERNLPRLNNAYGRVLALIDGARAVRSRIANSMSDGVDRLLGVEKPVAQNPAEPVQTATEPQAETQAETQVEPAQPIVEPNNESAVPRPVAQTPQGGGIVAWFKATNSRIANAMADQIDKWFFAGQPATPTTPSKPAEFVAVEHEEEIEVEIAKLKDEAKAEKLEALQLAQAEVLTLETQQSDLQTQAESLAEREYGTAIRELAEITYRLTEARKKVSNIEAEIATIDGQDYRPQAIANLEAGYEQGQDEETGPSKGLLAWLPDLSSSSANGRLLSLLIAPEQFLQSKKTPFDVSEELIVLRQTKPNTWQRSMLRKLFRERYAAQLRGIALLRSEVEEVFNKNPETSLDDLRNLFKKYQDKYALPDLYEIELQQKYFYYQELLDEVKKIKAEYENDHNAFLTELFGELPKSPATIVFSKDYISIGFQKDDYERIIDSGEWGRKLDHREIKVKSEFGVIVSGAIIAINLGRGDDVAATIAHERQHVLHEALFGNITNDEIEEIYFDSADEILAQFAGNDETVQDIKDVMWVNPDSNEDPAPYDYFASYDYNRFDLKSKYNSDVVLAIDAYEKLLNFGLSHPEIRAIFEGESLSRWPRLANRLSIAYNEQNRFKDWLSFIRLNIFGKTFLHSIGLANNNTIQVSSKFTDLSENHAEFYRIKNGGLSVKDLGSKGTYIDGRKISANVEVELREGQAVYFGDIDRINGFLFFVIRKENGQLDLDVRENYLARQQRTRLALFFGKIGDYVIEKWSELNSFRRNLALNPRDLLAKARNWLSSSFSDEILSEKEQRLIVLEALIKENGELFEGQVLKYRDAFYQVIKGDEGFDVKRVLPFRKTNPWAGYNKLSQSSTKEYARSYVLANNFPVKIWWDEAKKSYLILPHNFSDPLELSEKPLIFTNGLSLTVVDDQLVVDWYSDQISLDRGQTISVDWSGNLTLHNKEFSIGDSKIVPNLYYDGRLYTDQANIDLEVGKRFVTHTGGNRAITINQDGEYVIERLDSYSNSKTEELLANLKNELENDSVSRIDLLNFVLDFKGQAKSKEEIEEIANDKDNFFRRLNELIGISVYSSFPSHNLLIQTNSTLDGYKFNYLIYQYLLSKNTSFAENIKQQSISQAQSIIDRLNFTIDKIRFQGENEGLASINVLTYLKNIEKLRDLYVASVSMSEDDFSNYSIEILADFDQQLVDDVFSEFEGMQKANPYSDQNSTKRNYYSLPYSNVNHNQILLDIIEARIPVFLKDRFINTISLDSESDPFITHQSHMTSFWDMAFEELGVERPVWFSPYQYKEADKYDYHWQHSTSETTIANAGGSFFLYQIFQMTGNLSEIEHLLNHEAVHNTYLKKGESPRQSKTDFPYEELTTDLLAQMITRQSLDIPPKNLGSYSYQGGVNRLIELMEQIDASRGKNTAVALLIRGVTDYGNNLAKNPLQHLEEAYNELGGANFDESLRDFSDDILRTDPTNLLESPSIVLTANSKKSGVSLEDFKPKLANYTVGSKINGGNISDIYTSLESEEVLLKSDDSESIRWTSYLLENFGGGLLPIGYGVNKDGYLAMERIVGKEIGNESGYMDLSQEKIDLAVVQFEKLLDEGFPLGVVDIYYADFSKNFLFERNILVESDGTIRLIDTAAPSRNLLEEKLSQEQKDEQVQRFRNYLQAFYQRKNDRISRQNVGISNALSSQALALGATQELINSWSSSAQAEEWIDEQEQKFNKLTQIFSSLGLEVEIDTLADYEKRLDELSAIIIEIDTLEKDSGLDYVFFQGGVDDIFSLVVIPQDSSKFKNLDDFRRQAQSTKQNNDDILSQLPYPMIRQTYGSGGDSNAGETLMMNLHRWTGRYDEETQILSLSPRANEYTFLSQDGEITVDGRYAIETEDGEIVAKDKIGKDGDGYKPIPTPNDGNIFNRFFQINYDGRQDIPTEHDGKKLIYRGISAAMMQELLQDGGMTAGEVVAKLGEAGNIYFATDPNTAFGYAADRGTFDMASFNEPAYVLAIEWPEGLEANSAGEVIIQGFVPVEAVIHAYEIKPYAIAAGHIRLAVDDANQGMELPSMADLYAQTPSGAFVYKELDFSTPIRQGLSIRILDQAQRLVEQINKLGPINAITLDLLEENLARVDLMITLFESLGLSENNKSIFANLLDLAKQMKLVKTQLPQNQEPEVVPDSEIVIKIKSFVADLKQAGYPEEMLVVFNSVYDDAPHYSYATLANLEEELMKWLNSDLEKFNVSISLGHTQSLVGSIYKSRLGEIYLDRVSNSRELMIDTLRKTLSGDISQTDVRTKSNARKDLQQLGFEEKTFLQNLADFTKENLAPIAGGVASVTVASYLFLKNFSNRFFIKLAKLSKFKNNLYLFFLALSTTLVIGVLLFSLLSPTTSTSALHKEPEISQVQEKSFDNLDIFGINEDLKDSPLDSLYDFEKPKLSQEINSPSFTLSENLLQDSLFLSGQIMQNLTYEDNFGNVVNMSFVEYGDNFSLDNLKKINETIKNHPWLINEINGKIVFVKVDNDGSGRGYVIGDHDDHLQINIFEDTAENESRAIVEAIADSTRFNTNVNSYLNEMQVAYYNLFYLGRAGIPGNYFKSDPSDVFSENNIRINRGGENLVANSNKDFAFSLAQFIEDPEKLRIEAPYRYNFFKLLSEGIDPLSIVFVTESEVFSPNEPLIIKKKSLEDFVYLNFDDLPQDIRMNNESYKEIVERVSLETGVPVSIIVGVMNKESGDYDNRLTVISEDGYASVGLMQIRPGDGPRPLVGRPNTRQLFDAYTNITIGANILKAIYENSSLGNGNWRDSLALYNAGSWETLFSKNIRSAGGFQYADEIINSISQDKFLESSSFNKSSLLGDHEQYENNYSVQGFVPLNQEEKLYFSLTEILNQWQDSGDSKTTLPSVAVRDGLIDTEFAYLLEDADFLDKMKYADVVYSTFKTTHPDEEVQCITFVVILSGMGTSTAPIDVSGALGGVEVAKQLVGDLSADYDGIYDTGDYIAVRVDDLSKFEVGDLGVVHNKGSKSPGHIFYVLRVNKDASGQVSSIVIMDANYDASSGSVVADGSIRIDELTPEEFEAKYGNLSSDGASAQIAVLKSYKSYSAIESSFDLTCSDCNAVRQETADGVKSADRLFAQSKAFTEQAKVALQAGNYDESDNLNIKAATAKRLALEQLNRTRNRVVNAHGMQNQCVQLYLNAWVNTREAVYRKTQADVRSAISSVYEATVLAEEMLESKQMTLQVETIFGFGGRTEKQALSDEEIEQVADLLFGNRSKGIEGLQSWAAFDYGADGRLAEEPIKGILFDLQKTATEDRLAEARVFLRDLATSTKRKILLTRLVVKQNPQIIPSAGFALNNSEEIAEESKETISPPVVSVTPSITKTPTPTPSVTKTPTPTPSVTITNTPTPSLAVAKPIAVDNQSQDSNLGKILSLIIGALTGFGLVGAVLYNQFLVYAANVEQVELTPTAIIEEKKNEDLAPFPVEETPSPTTTPTEPPPTSTPSPTPEPETTGPKQVVLDTDESETYGYAAYRKENGVYLFYNRDGWKPIDLTVLPDYVNNRNPEDYLKTIQLFQVDESLRYRRKGKKDTYCNIYVWDVTSAMGVPIPHWIDNEEKQANDIYNWLQTDFAREELGWRPVSAEEAQAYANQGIPAIATTPSYKDGSGGNVSGHMAMIIPGSGEWSEDGETFYPSSAQAGNLNFDDGTSTQTGFKGALENKQEIVYYVNEGSYEFIQP